MDSGRGCFWAFCSSCVAEAEDEAKRSDEEFRVVFVFVVVDDVLVDASAGSGEPPAAAALSLPRSFWSSLDPRPWNFNLNAPRREEAGRGAEASPLSSSHSTEATPGSIFFFFFLPPRQGKKAPFSRASNAVSREAEVRVHTLTQKRDKNAEQREHESCLLFSKKKKTVKISLNRKLPLHKGEKNRRKKRWRTNQQRRRMTSPPSRCSRSSSSAARAAWSSATRSTLTAAYGAWPAWR